MNILKRIIEGLRRYPTAIFSVIVIGGLIVLSLSTAIFFPLPKAIQMWQGGGTWAKYPEKAAPTWVNIFRGDKLPETIILSTDDSETSVEELSSTMTRYTTELEFDYGYSVFPPELSLFFSPEYESKAPQVTAVWITPDGREFQVFKDTASPGQQFSISSSRAVENLVGGKPRFALFMAPDDNPRAPIEERETQEGTYRVQLSVLTFEPESTYTTELVVFGHISGWAGTDHLRRDLGIGLLWGTPVALIFGMLAAICTSVTTFCIAAIGSWYGGWVDAAIQRICEVNIMLPLLPILIMIGTFYNTTLWTILGVIIVLGIFSAGIKTYRAMFMQVKNSPYIEAARAYGASNLRIVFRYLIPFVAPVMLPQFVLGIPRFVFLEASIALLGVSDPTLPTWGKILSEGRTDLYLGAYHSALLPALMLIVTGLSFSMLGYALDRVFNPRLRTS